MRFYVTTPIYYVNDVPHIGHAYTTVAADVLARYHCLKGEDTYFLTGTDEHGQKVYDAATEKKLRPKEFVDGLVDRFKSAWEKLGISNNDFIRTTDARHKKVVQEIFSKLIANGDIYKGEYEGWYCVTCENYVTESSLKEDIEGRKLCPHCGRKTKRLKEETYFFKLSKYQKKLIKHINEHEDFIQPPSRRNEVLRFLEQDLHDLSVTRTAFSWGINIIEDPKHVVYVWFDALINYISALGWPDHEKYKKYWENAQVLHLMGKEIVRFHAVTWPCMLMAADIPLPKIVFGHGWWTVEGKKMSKSIGNVVDPLKLADEFGVDPVRYFILREVPFGSDGDFSMNSFKTRFNADLANDLGNLLHRTLNMIEKYYDGKLPTSNVQRLDRARRGLPNKSEIQNLNIQTPDIVDEAMGRLAFSEALAAIWALIGRANKYIEESAPWKLAKDESKKEELAAVMYNLIDVLKTVAILVTPFIPTTAKKMWEQLNFAESLEKVTSGKIDRSSIKIAGTVVKKGKPLFPRLEK
ncbi:methionine--tRNA ligase [Candidatus Margulisiibacteriota bacterium]